MQSVTPSMLEIMDRQTIDAVEQWRSIGIDASAQAMLVAQFDAPGEAAGIEADRMVEICERNGAMEAYRSEDEEQSELLVGARRMAIPAIEAIGDWLLDDVGVPRSRLAEAMTRFQDVAAARDVRICTFGHAGDGNLHPTILTPRGDREAAERGVLAFDDLMRIALDLGGTITGEHGVGNMKNLALADELDEPARDLHSRVKAAWDPEGILNPGKLLPRW
jgi:glycolate oxidase